ncbi:hypothetical protein T552_03182 [Pneumocystis carinii B80]|uniref:Uncharacterized protein n=1 Tax=Pneumocystis carinii (strain B80) TaxID=1408658 RepID=A0A0W4ZBW6_PNEC8|nr:hypothetical protein T552_03182 [Pneumocystis carinii B80]KTW25908.1 hypothetical protein T552_03182 [Pneumocystis carinii B80]
MEIGCVFHQYCTVCDRLIENSYGSLLYCSGECKKKDSEDDYREISPVSYENSFSGLTTVSSSPSYTGMTHLSCTNMFYECVYWPRYASMNRLYSFSDSEEINEYGSPAKYVPSTVPASLINSKVNSHKYKSPVYRTNSFSSLSVRSIDLVTPVMLNIRNQDTMNKDRYSQIKELRYPTKAAGSIYNTDGPGTGIRKLFCFEKSPNTDDFHQN